MPTTNQIVSNTDSGRKQRSTSIKWKHITTLLSKNKKYIQEYIYFVTSQTNPSKFYTVKIRPQLPTNYDFKSGNKSIVANCNCKDFLFRQEYALHTSDNARIEVSNGQPANITNPTNKKYYCKHILAVMNDCLEKNKKDVQRIKILNQNKIK